jgi:hypothetical protein
MAVVTQDEVLGQSLLGVDLAAALTFLLRPQAFLDRFGPLLGSGQHQPGCPLVVGAAGSEGFSPVAHCRHAGTPPVHDGRGRFIAHGAGQFFIDQQTGAATRRVKGTASWPGDRRRGPTGDNDKGVAVQARRAVAAPEGRRGIRAEQESHPLALSHGITSRGNPPEVRGEWSAPRRSPEYPVAPLG